MEILQRWLKDYLQWIHWKAFTFAFVILLLWAAFFLTSGSERHEAVFVDTAQLAASIPEERVSDRHTVSHSQEIMATAVQWKADIKGAVLYPGVYEVELGMRIQDLIDKAGGAQPEADMKSLNLAQLLEDQMMVYVPKNGENLNSSAIEEEVSSQLVYTPSAATENSALIDLNMADAAKLQELNGIGEKKADLIIQYRKEQGPFQTIEDLMKVKGIGEKTFEALKDQVWVSAE